MKNFIIISLFLSVIISCKKDIPPDDSPKNDKEARDGLYVLMDSVYYWYKLMPAVNPEDYKDPYEILEALRYKERDRWSFVADYKAFLDEMEGTFVGHGFRLGLDPSGNARIALIYSKSPLYANGVRRGWIVKKINDILVAPILISGDAAAYNNMIRESKEGVTNKFEFVKPDGSVLTVSSTKAKFTVNSVLLYDTLHLSSGLAGHLVFDAFIEPSSQELAAAFAFFKEQNIKDLILDLRYNSGGILGVAVELASYIGGSPLVNKVFLATEYNDKLASTNDTSTFETVGSPLTISRLVSINTRATASASEAVINGLLPYVSVTCLGDTTDGKPSGMNLWSYESTYVFAPVTFMLVNALGQGDYFDGIYPDKYVPDDITRDFSDRKEACLMEAIHFLETGSLSAKGIYEYNKQKYFLEKPRIITNTIVPGRGFQER
jgi:C-terminal processing protease CtpA/Prc